jgi:hypothetical protein
MKIPKAKRQIPSKGQGSGFKFQAAPRRMVLCLEISPLGLWSFIGIWNLELGIPLRA